MATLRLSKARPATPWAARRAGEDYGVTARPSWRDVDWGRHIRQVDIGGRSVNYVELGSGDDEPVLFIHGLGGCWQNWLENLPRFAQDRRVVALDLPGFGYSDMPAREVSIERYGVAVEEFCDRLELSHAVVVGNSMGGFIGAQMAIEFPDRVERLVLVSAAGISINRLRAAPLLTLARMISVTGPLLAARSTEISSRARLRHLLVAPVFRHPTRLAADLLREQLRRTGRPGFFPALAALTTYDFRERLSAIGCPTLIVWGSDDMLVPVEDAELFEQVIPDSRKLVMEDTGHVPMLERPETFNDALAGFLAETGHARHQTATAARR